MITKNKYEKNIPYMQSIVLKILSHLGQGVGFGYPTHTQTQILRHLKAPTQNPYPNTQKIPYPYPNTQKN